MQAIWKRVGFAPSAPREGDRAPASASPAAAHERRNERRSREAGAVMPSPLELLEDPVGDLIVTGRRTRLDVAVLAVDEALAEHVAGGERLDDGREVARGQGSRDDG